MNADAAMSENKNKNAGTEATTIDDLNTVPVNSNNTNNLNGDVTRSSSPVVSNVTTIISSGSTVTPMIAIIEAAVVASKPKISDASTLPVPPKNAPKTTMTETIADDDETQNMRLILPVFIQNERKYSQPERQRKIQSSPVKSMRRFSQDSSEIQNKHLNVSRWI